MRVFQGRTAAEPPQQQREMMTTMMEETKRSANNTVNGAANLFSSSDDKSKNKRPPSAAAAAAAPSAAPPKKVVVKSADMKDDMQNQAIDCALYAFEKYSVEKEIAEHIKKEFDKKHGPTWHCIVGRNFGSYVTHETNHFVYFYLDQKAILLFKSG